MYSHHTVGWLLANRKLGCYSCLSRLPSDAHPVPSGHLLVPPLPVVVGEMMCRQTRPSPGAKTAHAPLISDLFIQTTTNLPPTSFALPAHPHDTVQPFGFTHCIFSCSCVMRILLTGSSGVVGSAILVDLLKKGHRVTALDAVSLPNGIRQILPPDASCRLSTHIVDLTDFKRLDDVQRQTRRGDPPVSHPQPTRKGSEGGSQ
jgi:hypothetical protein